MGIVFKLDKVFIFRALRVLSLGVRGSEWLLCVDLSLTQNNVKPGAALSINQHMEIGNIYGCLHKI